MPILPNIVLFVILQFWSVVLHLVSTVRYKRQLTRYRHHWLVQLHQIADLSCLEQACTAFHPNNGLLRDMCAKILRLLAQLNLLALFGQPNEKITPALDAWAATTPLFLAPSSSSVKPTLLPALNPTMWLYPKSSKAKGSSPASSPTC